MSEMSSVRLFFVFLITVVTFSGCKAVADRAETGKPWKDRIGIRWERDPQVAYYRVHVLKKNGKIRTYDYQRTVDCWDGKGVRCWVTAFNNAGMESPPSRTCP
jgi:hypothetical protein